MSEYKLKPGKLGNAICGAYQKIEHTFVENFLNEDGSMKTGKIGDTVVSTYQQVENNVVGSYKKVEKAFVDAFLEKVDTQDDTIENK